ncbi:MAG: penicillin-binding protein 2 [Bacteroidia bacterium]|nr:penicillin-binding protein 2 [Bacteroidia bacterium]
MSKGGNRNISLIIAVISIGLLFSVRLFYLQVIDKSYVDFANANSKKILTIHPNRGLIYDRNNKLIAYNDNFYDLSISYPFTLKNFDTTGFCTILEITKENFIERLKKAEKTVYKGSATFYKNLEFYKFAALQERMYDYGKFYIEVKSDRKYNTASGAHVLGYIGEISKKQLEEKNEENYYSKGDFIGLAGLEKYYEPELRGIKGEEVILVDSRGKQQGSYSKGKFDKIPIPGKKVTTTLDLTLQEYASRLMQNKAGSVVAIEPSTGEILTLVSSPEYNPEALTIRNKKKNYGELLKDPTLPLFNRAVTAAYPPGSVFKLLNGLIGLEEEMIYPETTFPCYKGYSIGNLHVNCHPHPQNLDLRGAVANSCNAYFCYTFKEIIENPKYKSPREAYIKWRNYMLQFGLDNKLGSDINFESEGNIPTPEFYDKMHNNRWGFTRIISLSIGQGEILITPLQMANVISTIANRGYYYTPHCIRKIDNKNAIPKKFKTKHKINIKKEHFEVVVEGMRNTLISGTAARTGIEGIEICGKTGTVQNPHGKNHAVFMCFAPKDNPKIAIACIVENAGFGATWAAPVATLLIEKYFKRDSVSSKPEMEERILKARLLKNPNDKDSAAKKEELENEEIKKQKNDSTEKRTTKNNLNKEAVIAKKFTFNKNERKKYN